MLHLTADGASDSSRSTFQPSLHQPHPPCSKHHTRDWFQMRGGNGRCVYLISQWRSSDERFLSEGQPAGTTLNDLQHRLLTFPGTSRGGINKNNHDAGARGRGRPARPTLWKQGGSLRHWNGMKLSQMEPHSVINMVNENMPCKIPADKSGSTVELNNI